jgi:hypothetical protein
LRFEVLIRRIEMFVYDWTPRDERLHNKALKPDESAGCCCSGTARALEL